jgi:hypothetical protein
MEILAAMNFIKKRRRITKKVIFFIGFAALLLFLPFSVLIGETSPDADFLGKWQAKCRFEGGPATMEVQKSGKVIYTESNCPAEILIVPGTYVCDSNIFVNENGEAVLEFEFVSPRTGRTVKLSFIKMPDGTLKGSGRTPRSFTELIMRRAN